MGGYCGVEDGCGVCSVCSVCRVCRVCSVERERGVIVGVEMVLIVTERSNGYG